jgi:dethiobiotin synthetase
VKRQTIFITGTDTGVGKTVVACLLAKHWRTRNISVAAFKPVCSGGREDARALHSTFGGLLTLDEINPWHFRAPVAPLLAARAENKKVILAKVVAHGRRLQKRFPILIVEGAGGLLSPLGEKFDSVDLIETLGARPVIVAPNRLGAINQVLLTLTAMPGVAAQKAQVILITPPKPDIAARGNLKFLAAKLNGRIHELPWIDRDSTANRRVRKVVAALAQLLEM